MNRLTSKQRKLVYVMCIAVLLVPVIWLGMPATGDEDSGGKLAQLAREYELREDTLGNVDPTSATMNLVLLGFRGIAVDLLWLEGLEQQETKNWAQLRSTVDSIIMLQPHFVKVWQHQGWNLAYNVSVEWDAVKDRWYWVKQGGKFLMRGSARNRKYPELYWDVAYILGAKMGRSDEWRFFRKFFKVDPDTEKFNGGPDPQISQLGTTAFDDNYLAAKAWFQLANDREGPPPLRRQHIEMRMLFRQGPVRAQLDYADALQREGSFDERTRSAWEVGFKEWTEVFGREYFVSPGGRIQLEVSSGEEIRRLAEENDKDEDEIAHWVDRYQKMANYRYWRERADAEQDLNTVAAHREIYQGQQLFLEGKTGPKYYRAKPGACEKLEEITDLPPRHVVAMKALCGSEQLLSRDRLAKAVSMKDDDEFEERIIEPLRDTRKLIEPVSEPQRVLESGMKKFAELLDKHPSFKIEDRMVEEGLLALTYWRAMLAMNYVAMPEAFPLKELWINHQDRIPTVEAEFRRAASAR